MQTILRALIVDDENFVREGLRYLIDWKQAGFVIAGEAKDGEEALEQIRLLHPDLVLLDIRMPGMDGTLVMQKAREIGFSGEFLILSGFSDFAYARAAIQYGAFDYIVKPIDEMQLLQAVNRAGAKIRENRNSEKSISQVMRKARSVVLTELLEGRARGTQINYGDYDLDYPVFRVILYESYIPDTKIADFAKLLSLSGDEPAAVDAIEIGRKNVVLLKGYQALERFDEWLLHAQRDFQPNSLIDSIFLACGRTVHSLQEIAPSYEECRRLSDRRFFCTREQHVLTMQDLPPKTAPTDIDEGLAKRYADELASSVRTLRRKDAAQLFSALRDYFAARNVKPLAVQHFMIDLLLQVKSRVLSGFGNAAGEVGFDSNTGMIEALESASCFNDIIQYCMEQFEKVMQHAKSSSSESVLDDVLYYIEENYAKKLTLESIGPLFGYNSAYLGKIFAARTGCSFNVYRDRVRIEKSKALLSDTPLKIYEIAERVGYRNVDIYNQKFKKQEGISPSDYRRRLGR
ncbi:MAG: response regulator [Lachnospiraceae bacterium]